MDDIKRQRSSVGAGNPPYNASDLYSMWPNPGATGTPGGGQTTPTGSNTTSKWPSVKEEPGKNPASSLHLPELLHPPVATGTGTGTGGQHSPTFQYSSEAGFVTSHPPPVSSSPDQLNQQQQNSSVATELLYDSINMSSQGYAPGLSSTLGKKECYYLIALPRSWH